MLSRAVDIASGAACWLYRTRQPVKNSTAAIELNRSQLESLKALSGDGILGTIDCGLDDHHLGYLSVRHSAGQPLPELIRQGPPSEVILLQVLLALARILSLAEMSGQGHRNLQPAFIFVAHTSVEAVTAPQIVVQIKTAQNNVVQNTGVNVQVAGFGYLPGVLLGAKTQRALTSKSLAAIAVQWLGNHVIEDTKKLPQVLSQSALSGPARELIRWYFSADVSCDQPAWLQVIQKLLLVLAAKQLLAVHHPALDSLREQLKYRAGNTVLDFAPMGDCLRAIWLEEKSEHWWQNLLIPSQLRAGRNILKAFAKPMAEGPMLGISALEFIADESSGWLVCRFPLGETVFLSDRLTGPLSVAIAYPLLAEICEQLQTLEQRGLVVKPLSIEQIMVDRQWRPIILPERPKALQRPVNESSRALTHTPQKAAVAGDSASLVRSVAEIAYRVLVGQALRLSERGLQLGAGTPLPAAVQAMLMDCFSPHSNPCPTLAQMQELFAKIPNEPVPIVKKAQKTTKNAVKQNERKKLLLLLLLILLFQVMANVGIIVAFQ